MRRLLALLVVVALMPACRSRGGEEGPVAALHTHAGPPATLETPATPAPAYVLTTEAGRLTDADRAINAASGQKAPERFADLVRLFAALGDRPVLLRGYFIDDTVDRSGFLAAERTARFNVGFVKLDKALFERIDARVAFALRSGLSPKDSDDAASMDLLVQSDGTPGGFETVPQHCARGCAQLLRVCWREGAATACYDAEGKPVPLR